MKRHSIALLLAAVALLVTACQLSASGMSTAVRVASDLRATAVVQAPATRTPAPFTPIPTLTPPPTAAPPTTVPATAVLPVACQPRADWPRYTVVPGDTLGSIAARAGSTTSAIAQANCLADANRIIVGQQLAVPRLPQPPTPSPQPTNPLPVINNPGEPPANMCAVIANPGLGPVPIHGAFGDAGFNVIAYLATWAPHADTHDAFYQIVMPGNTRGWVHNSRTLLSAGCFNQLPVFMSPGEPPLNACNIEVNDPSAPVEVFESANSNSRKLGYLGNWAPWVQSIVGGYEIRLPDGRPGWVQDTHTHFIGACGGGLPVVVAPDPPSGQTCMVEANTGHRPYIFAVPDFNDSAFAILGNHAPWISTIVNGSLVMHEILPHGYSETGWVMADQVHFVGPC